MDLQPEPARRHDLAPALELLGRADLPEKGVAASFGHYFVVHDDGRLVGLAGLEIHGEDGLLRSVAVEPEYRGQGLARALVEVVERAERLKLRAVYLLTTTARDYFGRCGFTDCARADAPAGIRDSWEFSTGCPTTSAFMRRDFALTTTARLRLGASEACARGRGWSARRAPGRSITE